MLEAQRLAGTNVDFCLSFQKMTDNEITVLIDKAIINYTYQKIEGSTDKLTPGFYSHLFISIY
ncbi:hypothetical protein ATE47_01650 [Chryseobacterium sp. IHB B 17019]|nr:hypothetical protein ATE47_01650 [Chryseobacterium sp. IHB B 17019]